MRPLVLYLLQWAPQVGFAMWPFSSSEGDKDKDKAKGKEGQSPPPQVNGMPQGMPPGGMPPGMMMGMPPGMMMMGGPGGMQPGMMMGGPGGMPVVMDGHFGFDPWEDLHHNVANKVMDHAQAKPGDKAPVSGGPLVMGGPPPFMMGGPGGPLVMGGPASMMGPQIIMGGGGPGGMPMEIQLGSLFDMFAGDHAGQVGRAEGSFQVDDDHVSRVRISALLPGYKLGGTDLNNSTGPLSVKVLGHRSVVVSGSQQMGPFVKTWQRSFHLPKGSNTDKIAVTYMEKSGNLSIEVPHSNNTGNNMNATGKDDDDDWDDDMEGLPPALRAMKEGLPGILGQVGQMGGPQKAGGFLMPPMGEDPFLGQVMQSLGALHPRNHLPHSEPVPEDAQVDFVGCFEETQLSKAELKYYGESNAAAFQAMYWHARADHTPYFAMARHDEPLGHAFTVRSFAHENEKPKWGVYDGCGTHCEDDTKRWCGCATEAGRGYINSVCTDNAEVKRFAVYKIAKASMQNETSAGPSAKSSGEAANKNSSVVEAAAGANAPGGSTAEAAQNGPGHGGRPYWQLAPSEGASGSPSIEIMVPQGTVPEAKGREILFFNASGASANSTGKAAEGALAAASGQAQGHSPVSTTPAAGKTEEASTTLPSTPRLTPAPAHSTVPPRAEESSMLGAPNDSKATPVGKVRLPVGVNPDDCTWEAGRVTEDGNQVLKCVLKQNDVRNVPIKVVDEL